MPKSSRFVSVPVRVPVPVFVRCPTSLTSGQWLWLLAGGLSFSIGTSAYVLQWPDFKWHQVTNVLCPPPPTVSREYLT